MTSKLKRILKNSVIAILFLYVGSYLLITRLSAYHLSKEVPLRGGVQREYFLVPGKSPFSATRADWSWHEGLIFAYGPLALFDHFVTGYRPVSSPMWEMSPP